MVFRDFFTAGLRFPCDVALPSILDIFSMKMHQLTPNSIIELSKFFWIQRTFEGQISADIFARLFKLHIQRKVIKLDDGELYEAHYGCCIFNTRRKNANQKLVHIQLVPCSNNKWDDDWLQHWFYVKVDMSEAKGLVGPLNHFFCNMGPMNAICTTPFNQKLAGFKNGEDKFYFACTFLGGRDVIEEYVGAEVWPLSHGGKPNSVVDEGITISDTTTIASFDSKVN